MQEQEQIEIQSIPVKVYKSQERLTVAAPMPGLEASDVHVEVTRDDYLVLHGEVRGVLKGQKDLLIDEWTVGGYHRNVALPYPVDGERANVTYGNGVLVVALPLAEETKPALLSLKSTGAMRGEHAGNAGRSLEAPPSEAQ